ncbi:MAG: PhoH family protein [Bacteroidota bacterium]|nr:PhoH family protein [Bacteroidota bacterium]GDX48741.1 phosphate starvation protein PhoH [Bacteroidota bacterium]
MTELTISIDSIDPIDFLGVNNSRLNILKRAFPKLKIVSRGNVIKAEGSHKELEQLQEKVNQMIQYVERYGRLSDKHAEDILEEDSETEDQAPASHGGDVIVYGTNGTIVRARTPNQKRMVAESEQNDILFAIGPAGTGKTYTAVALAVRALKNKTIKKIILTRPAVEAGESLGFLPGDLKEKIDPYLRPLYDALDDMIPPDKLAYYITNRVIEIAPLAFMRGRTLDHAFIILDEAQNTTDLQLKMFLTRIGPNAKAIITGDLTQIDLPKNQRSGLFKGLNILKNIPGIAHIFLSDHDVVRHRLVKQIINAYEKDTERQESGADDSTKPTEPKNK